MRRAAGVRRVACRVGTDLGMDGGLGQEWAGWLWAWWRRGGCGVRGTRGDGAARSCVKPGEKEGRPWVEALPPRGAHRASTTFPVDWHPAVDLWSIASQYQCVGRTFLPQRFTC